MACHPEQPAEDQQIILEQSSIKLENNPKYLPSDYPTMMTVLPDHAIF